MLFYAKCKLKNRPKYFNMISRSILAFLLLSVTIISCSKEDSGPQTTKSKSVTKFSKSASSGFEGGVTTFAKSGNSSTGKNEGLFISQYPLAEFRNIQEVVYDSITEFEIGAVTNDTISTSTKIIEVSREFTGEVVKGSLWVPLESTYNSELYVGIPENMADSISTLQISVQITDSLDSELGYKGILLSLHDLIPDKSYFLYDGFFEIKPSLYEEIDQVPVYDDSGKVSGYTSGIVLPNFRIHHQSDDVSQSITRTFTLQIKSGDLIVTSDFSIHFVSMDLWSDRNCWLNQDSGCEDLFEE